MPTSSVLVGNQSLPLESEGVDNVIVDATQQGILDYLAHWIRVSVSPRLASMRGPVSALEVADACPVGHAFAWNHENTFMRPHPVSGAMSVALPGLWGWATSCEPSERYTTLVYQAHDHTFRVDWIFHELQIPDGYAPRSGLLSAVENAIRAACQMGYHPTYQPTPDDPPGRSIINAHALMGLRFVSGQAVRLQVVPRGDGDGHTKRFYPCYQATLSYSDRVDLWTPDPTGDAYGDSMLTLSPEGLDCLVRVLPAPINLL